MEGQGTVIYGAWGPCLLMQPPHTTRCGCSLLRVTAEDTETQRGSERGQGHTAVSKRAQILTHISRTPEFMCFSHHTTYTAVGKIVCWECWLLWEGQISRGQISTKLLDKTSPSELGQAEKASPKGQEEAACW